jgi:anti-sigma factor RsiW
MSQYPMSCAEYVELVTAYLEEALDGRTRRRFDRHLARCRGCHNYQDQFRAVLDLVGAICAGQLDPGFRDRLLEMFRARR